MSSTRFTADLEDIRFVLFDQLDMVGTLAGVEKYADFDTETVDQMIEGAYDIAQNVLSPLNGPGDRQGCSLNPETGDVTTPAGFKEAWTALAEGGWVSVSAPPEVGGVGAPAALTLTVTELFSGAAMAFTMYPGLTGAAGRMLLAFGPEGMGAEYAEKLFTGEWAGTMCLTEAGAGTSVGDNRCKALPTEDEGVYHLEGEKIFISGGDHDLTDNIIHLVLARLPDAPAGTKGLSLFLVPKFLVGEDFALGERNGAYVVGIEEKMGIHGSATCTLALGARGACKGWLLGEHGQGIELMFHMMNEARIGVGLQGLACGASAYQYARHYAQERIQGTKVENYRDENAERIAIVEHPDVRRMLMTQKVFVETMRSFTYRLAHRLDVAEATADEHAAQRLRDQVDLLVPVVKAHCTDLGFDVAVLAVQTLGGYGYIGEYPVEQLVRDGKIMSIYEGTNGVQALDLLGRKLRIRSGGLFMDWMQDVQKLLGKAAKEDLAADADAIGKALNSLAATAMHLGGMAMQRKLSPAMVQSYPFLKMFGIVALAIEALIQARVAKRLIAERGESDLLVGKLLNLTFYVRNILPQAVALAKSIQTSDESCLDPRLFRGPTNA